MKKRRMYSLLFWDGNDWTEIEEFPIVISGNEDRAYASLIQKYLRVEETQYIDDYFSSYRLQYWDQSAKSWNTVDFIPEEDLNHCRMDLEDCLEWVLDKYVGFKDTPVWLDDLSNLQLKYLYGHDDEIDQMIEKNCFNFGKIKICRNSMKF